MKYPTEEQEVIIEGMKGVVLDKDINLFDKFVTVNKLVFRFWKVGIEEYLDDRK